MKTTFKLTLTALAAALALTACKQENTAGAASATGSSASAPAGLETETKQISYAVGHEFGLQLSEAKKNGAEFDVKVIQDAITAQLEGKEPKMTDEQMRTAIGALMQKMQSHAEKQANDNLAAGEKFLAENKTKEGVKTTASGLQYSVKKEGTGNTAKLGDAILVEYTGKLIDGTVFDSSPAGQPVPFPVLKEGLIPGFVEGLQLMKAGGEYTLYMPAQLAYGTISQGKIPANSVLIFEIKVAAIEAGAASKAK